MNGILPVYKEAGMTSHDVVARLRRILHMKKIGHSGTLDPDATGVLLVLVGTACKTLPFLEDTDKEYIATMHLGLRTVSDDMTGEVLEEQPIQPIEDLNGILQSFVGKQKQLPPMISSVRVNGRKLYEYARKGEAVERPLRDVEIYEIELLDEQALQFRVACSSGTYIRSLCVDIAKASGNLGCMESLIRTKVGRFCLEDARTLAQIEAGDVPLFPIKQALSHYEKIAYEPIQEVLQGKKILLSTNKDTVAIVHDEEVVAIYRREENDRFRSVRGLW